MTILVYRYYSKLFNTYIYHLFAKYVALFMTHVFSLSLSPIPSLIIYLKPC